MKQLSKLHRAFLFILMLVVTCSFQGCSGSGKDRFALTTKDVDTNGNSLGDGYAWGFGNLGFMMNGHGLPDTRRTFVITHKSAEGKIKLIWPNFIYGNNQANAVAFENTIVFMAGLPDGRIVLMAQRADNPPIVITAAVLRLAAQRLGTSVIVPGTDYYFTKVRLPPGRIWLQGLPLSSKPYPPQGVFTVEITPDDLIRVMDETRRKAKLHKANKFEYLAEEGVPCHIDSKDVEEIGAATTSENQRPITPAVHKETHYVPQNERLYGNALLDASNHTAYFSTVHEPGRILKVALGNDPKTQPTVVSALVLEPEEDKTFNAVMDPQGGYAYFATDHPGHVVKIAVGVSNEPPRRIGSVLLDKNYRVRVGVADAAIGYGCFSVGNRLFKIRLGKANEPPSLVSYLEIPVGNMDLVSAVLDPTTHYAYFGSDSVKIYKVALGEGDSPLRYVGELTLPENERGLRGALIDPKKNCAWFTSNNGRLVKISLGEKDNLPHRIGALQLDSRYRYLEHTFGMDNAGYAYFGTANGGDADAAVLKIALMGNDELPRLVSSIPLPPDDYYIAAGIVDPINRILCLGVGSGDCKLLKLSLGEGNDAPKILGETRLYSKSERSD